jgi:hypothetical protein
VTVAGVSSVGFLFLGITVPALIPNAPQWLTVAFFGVGVACLVYPFVWSTLMGRQAQVAEPYWTASDTLRYMAEETRWARGLNHFARYDADLSQHFGERVIERKNPWLLAPSEFVKQAAREGTPIRVVGTRTDNGVVEPIEPAFWTSNIIGWSASGNPGQESYTHPSIASMPSESLVYRNLRIGQAGVRKTWPPVPLWLQLWDKVTSRNSANRQ